jgi:CheY-like chemotaxis protein
LRWVERGGPAVSAPTSRGFGMTLIEQSARGEGGDARMVVEAEGITWELTLRLPRPAVHVASRPKSAAVEQPSSAQPGQARAIVNAPARLVVEDEPLVALEIVACLEDAGAEIHGQAGTVKDAIRIIESASFDAALLDNNLGGEPVDEITAALTRRKVPFLFVTGYGSASLPRAFGKVALVAKPFSQQQLVEAAAQLVDQRGDIVRLKK